jgi:hypothetical protein
MLAVPKLPTDPSDELWKKASEYSAALIPQDLVDPRLMQPSTSSLRIRALTEGSRVAFRMEWTDETEDNRSTPNEFGDGCAVQMPSKAEPTIPAPQMGEPGRPVQITFWNAAWQAVAEGRGDTLQDLYPRANVDHYPFQAAALKPDSPEQADMAKRYAPARAAGNAMSRPPGAPIQDLQAEGPGSLSSLPNTTSKGSGRRIEYGWAVVITRELPAGMNEQPQGQVAFAVWDGAHEEVGARKMRTAWIPLARPEKP